MTLTDKEITLLYCRDYLVFARTIEARVHEELRKQKPVGWQLVPKITTFEMDRELVWGGDSGEEKWKAALAVAPQNESQWQPIETAPRDGKLILAHNSIMGVTCIVGWDKGREDDEPHWSDVPNRNQAESFWFNGNYFSHWMPLPQRPDTIKISRPEGHDSWSIEIKTSYGGGGGKD